MFAPHPDRLRVRRQSFSIRQTFHSRCNPAQPLGRKLLHRNNLHKIQHAQTSSKSRLPRSWQHMVGAGSVIACRLRRIIPHEDRACILNKRQVVSLNGNVFRRNMIRPRSRLFARRRDKYRAPRSQRFLCNRIPFRQFRRTQHHRPRQLPRSRDKQNQRLRIMLGLRHQIGCNKFRIARVAQNDGFRRPSQEINSTVE